MYADMTRCPQTEAEMEDYFYTLIGRQLSQPANDYEAVLSMAYPWNGQTLMIPPGVGPGIKQYPGAPFFGLTQQYSGGPKARVFLPTNTPDDLGYYTKCLQYVDDAAGTLSASGAQPAAQATGLVWAWYLAGPPNTYAPIMGPDEGTGGGDSGGGSTPGTGGLTEAQVQAMIDASLAPVNETISALDGRISAVETQLSQGLHAHGPVNLPIVVESLTSMRAKGDIDVQVKTGAATPPPDTSGSGTDDLLTLVVLKRLLDRDDDEASPDA